MSAPKRIVAATDLSAASDHALDFAANLASTLDAKLSIVHALEVPYPYPVPLPPGVPEDLRTRLEKRCAELRAHVRDVQVVVREGGTPWSEIVAFAEETGADLIVVGTHGRRGVTHLLLGSVAERVIRLSPVPVITVPSTADASRTAPALT
jgi:nucleotide-binding universal stress UspA family protein